MSKTIKVKVTGVNGKEIDPRMYSNAPGMHFISLHDAPEDYDEDEDSCCDDKDDMKNCADCPYGDECDDNECDEDALDFTDEDVEDDLTALRDFLNEQLSLDKNERLSKKDREFLQDIFIEILDLLEDDEDDDNDDEEKDDACDCEHCSMKDTCTDQYAFSSSQAEDLMKKMARKAESASAKKDNPLIPMLMQNEDFIKRVVDLINLGKTSKALNGPMVWANMENDTIGFVGLSEDRHITNDNVFGIGYMKKREGSEEVDAVYINEDGVGTTTKDDVVTAKLLSHIFEQFDAFEHAVYHVLTAWVTDEIR